MCVCVVWERDRDRDRDRNAHGILHCLKLVSFSPFPESYNTLPLFLLLILKSGAYLYESVQLRGADVFAIQQLQVREMVECVCGVVAQAADRVWMVEGITERKRVQLWEGAEVH